MSTIALQNQNETKIKNRTDETKDCLQHKACRIQLN